MVSKLNISNRLIFIIIFVIALTVRLWKLADYPVSLSMDEAAYGYNAYSILKTGRDEFGEFLPLAFRSAGDYKPPVDTYLMVPFVAVLGLNEISIRLPIALLGSLTVVVFVGILSQMKFGKSALFLSGLWLALSPWHIYYSRGGVSSVSSLFFMFLGLYSFLKWINSKRPAYAFLSSLSLSLSVWAYHAERVMVPLLFLLLVISKRKDLVANFSKFKKGIIIFVATLAVFAIPFIRLTFYSDAVAQRAASTSIMRESSLINSLHRGKYTNLAEFVFDNDVYLIFRHWAGKYLNYFDLRLWFWKGLQLTPPGYPDLGLLMVIDLPLFIVGIYALLKSKDRDLKSHALFWFFAGPIPASFTMNEQHPLRALVWLPFFGLVIASSFEYLVAKFSFRKVLIFYILLCLVNFIYFADVYLNHFPRHFSEYWQYGYKEVAIQACTSLEKYDEIVVSETFGSDGPLNTGLPYLYLLTYCEEDRDNYVKTGNHLEKLRFRRAKIEDFEDSKTNRLILASPWDFVGELSGKGNIIRRTYFKNGKDAFWYVENN